MLARKLVWFPLLDNDDWQCGWLCAEGEPEEWEKIFFSPHNLKQFLEWDFEPEFLCSEFKIKSWAFKILA